MRVFTTSEREAGGAGRESAFFAAFHSERPWIRWAAQSAEISVHGMPQTFSVYVLKKVRKSLAPNSLVTHSSRLRGFFTGKRRARAYEPTQSAASSSPRLRSASSPLSG